MFDTQTQKHNQLERKRRHHGQFSRWRRRQKPACLDHSATSTTGSCMSSLKPTLRRHRPAVTINGTCHTRAMIYHNNAQQYSRHSYSLFFSIIILQIISIRHIQYNRHNCNDELCVGSEAVKKAR